jgi:GNAT superfamily N-acetyltransferase
MALGFTSMEKLKKGEISAICGDIGMILKNKVYNKRPENFIIKMKAPGGHSIGLCVGRTKNNVTAIDAFGIDKKYRRYGFGRLLWIAVKRHLLNSKKIILQSCATEKEINQIKNESHFEGVPGFWYRMGFTKIMIKENEGSRSLFMSMNPQHS